MKSFIFLYNKTGFVKTDVTVYRLIDSFISAWKQNCAKRLGSRKVEQESTNLSCTPCEFLPFFLLCAGAMILAAANAADFTPPDAPDFQQSVVQVIATCQTHDPAFPWRRNAPIVREGYAVAIGEGRLITTEHLVRNHTLVEIRAARSGIKIPVVVTLSDFRRNLALLDISDSALNNDLVSVDVAGTFVTDDALSIVQFDNSGQFQASAGRISEISMFDIPRYDSSILAVHILTDMTLNGNSGTPVFKDGRLFGLTMRYDRQAKKCFVLPSSVIKCFLDDARLSPYPGAPTAGFLWEPLNDPHKRSYLGLSEQDGGVAVLRTLPFHKSALLPEDAIIEWDGIPIDARGYYDDPDFGRLLFSYLIRKDSRPGDVVQAAVIRKGRRMSVDIELRNAPVEAGAIPLNITGEQPEYLLDGGLLLIELTLDYLETRGPRWPAHTDPKLLHLYLRRFQIEKSAGDRVVLLSRVLPDPINVGYEQLTDMVISKVNDEDIRTLSDVFRIADRDGGLRKLTLESPDMDVVLDPNGLAAANDRIARNYRVPRLRHQKSAD